MSCDRKSVTLQTRIHFKRKSLGSFSENNLHYGSIYHNSAATYHSIVNATMQSGVYYRARMTVSEFDKLYYFFISVYTVDTCLEIGSLSL